MLRLAAHCLAWTPCLDSASGFVDSGEKLAASASYGLIGLYEGLLPFLLPIGLIAAVAASWRAFSARALPAVLLTALAAWLLAATRVVLLALINISALPAVTIHYSRTGELYGNRGGMPLTHGAQR